MNTVEHQTKRDILEAAQLKPQKDNKEMRIGLRYVRGMSQIGTVSESIGRRRKITGRERMPVSSRRL